MTGHIPPNPYPNGKGFSLIGFILLMTFTFTVGGGVIYGIKLLGEMIP